jgi:ELWxxDGT repeat protein
MRKTIPLLLVVVSLPLVAQTPYLVKDINATLSSDTKDSSPTEFAAFGNRILFAATTDAAGKELWSTDGTSGGTSMVADIIPGTGSASPGSFATVNGVLLFTSRDVNHGVELWTTDGTAAGTRLFLDVNPGPTSSSPLVKILFKNRMLFTADDGTNGRELWTTDGTLAGTRMVKDISPGSASSSPVAFAIFNDTVYFFAGGALWKTDGTDAGTVKVTTVNGRNLMVCGAQLFFEGFTAATDWEPWVSDGTESGTRMITEVAPGTKPSFDTVFGSSGFVALGDRVLFLANDSVHGLEMWISDGTAAGTHMIRDFVPGAKGMWDSRFTYIRVFNGRAFFTGFDSDHGGELWSTDGTDAGTGLFADLIPGPASSSPGFFLISAGKLYFGAGIDSFGTGLWVTDGVNDTHPIRGPEPGVAILTSNLWSINGKIYFAGTSALVGTEPWVSDGTDAGTHMIANLAPDKAPSSNAAPLAAAGNLLFFNATETTTPSLWRSDGTADGTFKISNFGNHDPLVPVGPLVFFRDQTNSPSLWMSDGTVEGTKPAADFLKRFGQWQFERFLPFGDTVFATIYDIDVYDSSLWKTTVVANGAAIKLGAQNPYGMVDAAGRPFFYAMAPSSIHNRALWTTDGTPAGTYAVIPELGADYSGVSPLAGANGAVFFLKTLQSETTKLWKSDGTLDGTVLVKDLAANVTPFSTPLTAAGHKVFFSIGAALWVSDGTDGGTKKLVDVPYYTYPHVESLAVAGDRVVFVGLDAVTGYNLWSSDGTPEGTKRLLNSGILNPQLLGVEGTVYFAASDDAHGAEIWTTDGTSEGTKLLFDLEPGTASSSPADFTRAGNLLYFGAFTSATGRELWALPLTGPRLSIGDVRVAEGDAGCVTARMTVSLAAASAQNVTVDYATSDGTAHAGDDYDAASGTLTFAPGETAKSIDVRVRGDAVPENNETFFITLRNAAGARVVKGEAAGVIEDDDQNGDLSVVPQFFDNTSSLYDAVHVSNAGPRAVTDITVNVTSAPAYGRTGCSACPIAQLAVGASADTAGDYFDSPQQVYLSATAMARQRDPQPSNNSATWTFNSNRTMGMTPAFLTIGTTATITAKLYTLNPSVTSSDPAVIAAPAAVTKVTAALGTFTVTALKPGTATLSLDGQQLLVTVVAAGAHPRWPGGLTISPPFTATNLDVPLIMTITPSGTAPVSGARATGTVTVTSAGKELARTVITGASAGELRVFFTSLGQIPYEVNYSGDANFLPDSASKSVFVTKGRATMTGGLERTPANGTYTLTVRTAGSPLVAPTGTLSVLNGGVEVAKVTLVPSTGGISIAHATINNLPASPALTINYAGDALYQSGSQQVRLVETRRHSAGH